MHGLDHSRLQAKIDISHVPYKGTLQAVTELLSGQVSLMLANTLSVLPFVNSSRLRALAISSAQRSAAASSLPTIDESGLPGYEASTWFGVMIPSGAPREVVNRLNTELRKIAQSKAVGDLLLGQGADALGTSAEEFAARIKSDIAKWAATIKAAGIRVE